MKVGMMLNLSADPGTDAPSYREVRGHALAAEAAGLDSVWVYDHLIFRFPPDFQSGDIREVMATWAALAEATNRIELGAMVLCTAFRNPAILAKMAAELDHVAEGRIILGLGCGWHQPEFDAFGIGFDKVVDKFEEALQIVVPLVRGESGVTFDGAHYRTKDAELRPRPWRTDMPVLIASFKPRMLRLTATYADAWNTAWIGDAAVFTERVAELGAACDEVGRDITEITLTAGVSVEVGEPDLDRSDEDRRKSLKGGEAEIAAGLQGFKDAGCAHVVASLNEVTPESIATLARAAKDVQ